MEAFWHNHNVLVVLLAAVANFGVSEASTDNLEASTEFLDAYTEILNCVFEDDKFTPTVDFANTFVNALEFNRNEYQTHALIFNQIMENLKRSYKDVMDDNIENDWDPFIKFIQAYKSQKGNKSLESFYEDYQVEYTPKQDSAGFIIEIYRKLKAYSIVADVTQYMYMATVHQMPRNVIGPHENRQFHHHHVAGVIRIGLEGTPIYIILDPSIGLPEPVILDLGRSVIIQGGLNEEFRFYWLPNNIFELMVDVRNRFAKNRTWEHVYTYELHYPFCAFRDKTAKERLLSPNQSITKLRGSDGTPVASFSFQLLPLDIPRTLKAFVRKPRNDPYKIYSLVPQKHQFTMTFEGIGGLWSDLNKPMERAPIIVDNDIRSVCELFNNTKVTPEDIVAKMNILKKEVFDDEELLHEIFDLQKKFDMVPNQESYEELKIYDPASNWNLF